MGIKQFFRSVWFEQVFDQNGEAIKGQERRYTRIYRRPFPKLNVGKKACRAAKRSKVVAMKAAGHFRGDNRPFEMG